MAGSPPPPPPEVLQQQLQQQQLQQLRGLGFPEEALQKLIADRQNTAVNMDPIVNSGTLTTKNKNHQLPGAGPPNLRQEGPGAGIYNFPGQGYIINSLEANINPRGGPNATLGPSAGRLSGGGLQMTSQQEALILLQQQRLLQQAHPEGVPSGFTGLPGILNPNNLNVNNNAALKAGLARSLAQKKTP